MACRLHILWVNTVGLSSARGMGRGSALAMLLPCTKQEIALCAFAREIKGTGTKNLYIVFYVLWHTNMN